MDLRQIVDLSFVNFGPVCK